MVAKVSLDSSPIPTPSSVETGTHIWMEGPDGEHNLRLSTRKPSSEMIAAASFNKLVERLTTSSAQHSEQCLLHSLRWALHTIVHMHVHTYIDTMGKREGGVKIKN